MKPFKFINLHTDFVGKSCDRPLDRPSIEVDRPLDQQINPSIDPRSANRGVDRGVDRPLDCKKLKPNLPLDRGSIDPSICQSTIDFPIEGSIDP